MLEPDCEAGADIILSSEEGDTTEEMLEKTLEHFKIIHGSELVAEDFQQVKWFVFYVVPIDYWL